MKKTHTSKKEADFAELDLIDQFREYLETETNLPYELVDTYVADYIRMGKIESNFRSWQYVNRYKE